MKLLIVLFFLFSIQTTAQRPDNVIKLTHYIFNEFTPGVIKMKSGETTSLVLNYNILTHEMVFNNNGKYLAIANPENVDTIYISNRKFVPLNNKFYEVLVNANMPLLLEFTSTIREPGASTGYGGNSPTAAVTSYKSLLSGGGAYELSLPDGYTVIPGYIFWIRKEEKLEKVTNEKQLIKIFPEKKDVINNAIKKNGLKISKREDIIMLVKLIE